MREFSIGDMDAALIWFKDKNEFKVHMPTMQEIVDKKGEVLGGYLLLSAFIWKASDDEWTVNLISTFLDHLKEKKDAGAWIEDETE